MSEQNRGEWRYGHTVLPAPAGLQVWTVWSIINEGYQVDGPFPVLFMAHPNRSLSVRVPARTSTFVDWDGRRQQQIVWEEDSTAERDIESFLDLGKASFYVARDWDTPWVAHGTDAFLTEEAAVEHAREQNEEAASKKRLAVEKAEQAAKEATEGEEQK